MPLITVQVIERHSPDSLHKGDNNTDLLMPTTSSTDSCIALIKQKISFVGVQWDDKRLWGRGWSHSRQRSTLKWPSNYTPTITNQTAATIISLCLRSYLQKGLRKPTIRPRAAVDPIVQARTISYDIHFEQNSEPNSNQHNTLERMARDSKMSYFKYFF